MCQNASEEEPKSSCAARRGPTAHPGALRPDERDVGPAPRGGGGAGGGGGGGGAGGGGEG